MTDQEYPHLEPNFSLGSYHSYFVECFAIHPVKNISERIGTGTAFTVRYRDRRYLVTNRHVLTGRDSRNRARDPEFPKHPDRVTFKIPLIAPDDARHFHEVNLVGAEDEPAFWWQHPEHGPAVDIAVIPLYDHLHPNFDASLAMYVGGERVTLDYSLLDSSPYRHAIPLRVTQELYVVGFPFYADPSKTSNSAVWTRGTIASEPHLGFDGTEAFLLDARTREGQSGSPVLRHDVVGSSRSSRRFPSYEVHHDILVGIYSGRIHKDLDIGFVWPAYLIREIIEAEYTPQYRDLLPLG